MPVARANLFTPTEICLASGEAPVNHFVFVDVCFKVEGEWKKLDGGHFSRPSQRRMASNITQRDGHYFRPLWIESR